jgi:hypothetical protein
VMMMTMIVMLFWHELGSLDSYNFRICDIRGFWRQYWQGFKSSGLRQCIGVRVGSRRLRMTVVHSKRRQALTQLHTFRSLSQDRPTATPHTLRSGVSTVNLQHSFSSLRSSNSCLRLPPRRPNYTASNLKKLNL